MKYSEIKGIEVKWSDVQWSEVIYFKSEVKNS